MAKATSRSGELKKGTAAEFNIQKLGYIKLFQTTVEVNFLLKTFRAHEFVFGDLF